MCTTGRESDDFDIMVDYCHILHLRITLHYSIISQHIITAISKIDNNIISFQFQLSGFFLHTFQLRFDPVIEVNNLVITKQILLHIHITLTFSS